MKRFVTSKHCRNFAELTTFTAGAEALDRCSITPNIDPAINGRSTARMKRELSLRAHRMKPTIYMDYLPGRLGEPITE